MYLDIEYIPRNMLAHTSLFIVAWYELILPISFRVASLALGQYNCPSACEATLKNMEK